MYDLIGFGRRVRFGLRTPQCAAIAVAALTAGCSADITRFDSTSFAFNDPPETASTAPIPPEAVNPQASYSNPVAQATPRGPYSAGARDVEVAALPDAAQGPSGGANRYSQQSWQRSPRGVDTSARAPAYSPAGQPPAARPAAVAVNQPIPTGETIVVQPGDTLYRLSRTHNVLLSELMQVNGLSSPDLHPGQQLVLPGSGRSASVPPVTAQVPVQSAPRAAPVSTAVASRYSGTYEVQPGDSLYQIARSHNVKYSELQAVNGITDPRRVMPGTVLKVPGGTEVALAEPARPATMSDAPSSIATRRLSEPAPAQNYVQPSVINSPQQDTKAVAPKSDKIATALPQAEKQAVDNTKLRWPVIGRVIAGFGGRPDGTHNDGINLSVPLGADVHAAESGVVAYAGSELKGYGNLILVRHDNGWVTAYAHNEEMLVKRGDTVRRGQVIAKAGKTGTVDRPQLHFELRQGSRPVDPTPFMEQL